MISNPSQAGGGGRQGNRWGDKGWRQEQMLNQRGRYRPRYMHSVMAREVVYSLVTVTKDVRNLAPQQQQQHSQPLPMADRSLTYIHHAARRWTWHYARFIPAGGIGKRDLSWTVASSTPHT